MRWGSTAAAQAARNSVPDDAALELADVPAAVVCAFCGQPDCSGCDGVLDEPTRGSGVVAIIPWERPGLGLVTRWWSTAHVATINHRAFFSALPDGDTRTALGFAILSEVVAVSGLLLTGLVLALPFMPTLPALLARDAVVQRALFDAVVWGVPLVSTLMVAIHALHGVLTDLAARREGSRRRGRGLRFGLYGCAWDVITLPLGLVLVAISDGPAAAARALPLGLTAPAHAVRGYLSGVHGLAQDDARRASRRAARWTGVGLLVLIASVALGVAALR